MKNITFKLLEAKDTDELSALLLNSNINYVKYFHPFDFKKESICKILSNVKYDLFFGVILNSCNFNNKLIGFYMLRGMDEGFSDPMYGVFVDAEYQHKGIARLTISHAECICRLYGYNRILLKVYSENIRARYLYESVGFSVISNDMNNKNSTFCKIL
jgi:GNAT superfamily N-acetyltransferase